MVKRLHGISIHTRVDTQSGKVLKPKAWRMGEDRLEERNKENQLLDLDERIKQWILEQRESKL